MAQLTVPLSDDCMDALQHYAEGRHVPVAALIQTYIDYLLAGAPPVVAVDSSDISGQEMAQWALHGGGLDFLKDEPDLYSEADGIPYE